MPSINHKIFREIWSSMTNQEKGLIQTKCKWEHMSILGVMTEWTDLIPQRLRDKFEKNINRGEPV